MSNSLAWFIAGPGRDWFYLLLWLIIWVLPCALVGRLWKKKGHSGAGGFWLSFFFTWVLGLIIGLVFSNAYIQKETTTSSPITEDRRDTTTKIY